MEYRKLNSLKVTCLILGVIIFAKDAAAIECYQCNSTHERTCAEALPQHHSLYSFPCNHLQEPRYCVKMTGMFEGELGTKRFCSARDWGNYCEWVQRPGDEREYRACVYTCGRNGCNGATTLALSSVLLMLLVPSIYLFRATLMS
ncbi:U-scoloptoxin(05)-Sm1a-like isoform X2 [Penaeus monodon]|uniref:U-scoloptoxin(05)-Sm1a-like isoform X2 n=1 Tax=Penaeus monodon TaxID=6687 RepID=UPI0018A6FFB8|nr:U-scoloptoxin(05)-Sm1a-like isoform X2 [Penaeus monodon]